MFTPACTHCGRTLTLMSRGKRERYGCRPCSNRRRRHRYQRDAVHRLVQRLRVRLNRGRQGPAGPIDSRSVVALLRDHGYDEVHDRDLIEEMRLEPLDAARPFTLDNATLVRVQKPTYY